MCRLRRKSGTIGADFEKCCGAKLPSPPSFPDLPPVLPTSLPLQTSRALHRFLPVGRLPHHHYKVTAYVRAICHYSTFTLIQLL